MSRYTFSSDANTPVGDSVRDPIASYEHGVECVEGFLQKLPPIAVKVGQRTVTARLVLEKREIRNFVSPDVHIMENGTYTVDLIINAHVTASSLSNGISASEPDTRMYRLYLPRFVGAFGGPSMPPEGQYFIVNGREFVMRKRERMVNSMWITTRDSKQKRDIKATMRSFSKVPGGECRYHAITRKDDGELFVSFKDRSFELGVIAKALGASSEEDFFDFVGAVNDRPDGVAVVISFPATMGLALSAIKERIKKTDDAAQADGMDADAGDGAGDDEAESGAARSEALDDGAASVQAVLDDWLLPHLSSRKEKLRCLAYGVTRLCRAMCVDATDSFDHFANKRLDDEGALLASTVCSFVDKKRAEFVEKMQDSMKKVVPLPELNATVLARLTTMFEELSKDIKHVFLVNKWVIPEGKTEEVTITPSRFNIVSHLAMSRQVIFDRSVKDVGMRMHHPSSFAFICPAETQDDGNIGLYKNLAATSRVSRPQPDLSWLPHAITRGVARPSDRMWLVVVNGQPHGVAATGRDYFNAFRAARLQRVQAIWNTPDLSKRRRRELMFRVASVTCSVLEDVREVRVWADAGRIVRPLWFLDAALSTAHGTTLRATLASSIVPGLPRVKDGRPIWDVDMWKLVAQGLIEMVDSACMDDAAGFIVAVGFQYAEPHHTHCELHSNFHYGLSAAGTPFCNFNQATRVQFQCHQSKQAVGVSHENCFSRLVTSHTLYTPQRPLVSTHMERVLRQAGPNAIPNGVNVMLAILMYGDNQEDASVWNRDAIQRGLMHSLYKKTEVIPDSAYPASLRRPTSVQLDGTARVPTMDVRMNEAVANSEKMGFVSSGVRTGVSITDVFMMNGGDVDRPHHTCVSSTQHRSPMIGDKTCSKHGQKGLIAALEDSFRLAYTEDGIRPDIVFNPHGLPSRMTVGQIMELVAATLALREGAIFDGSVFDAPGLAELRERLEESMSDPGGGRVLFDRYGKPLGRVIVAPIYYMRLYHMVADKWLAQSSLTGKTDPRTGQPVKGAPKKGSLRFGSMEMDAIIAWGMMNFFYERVHTLSDGTNACFCLECGLFALDVAAGAGRGGSWRTCRSCAAVAAREGRPYVPKVVNHYMSKAVLLGLNTLMAMGVAIRASFERVEEGEH